MIITWLKDRALLSNSVLFGGPNEQENILKESQIVMIVQHTLVGIHSDHASNRCVYASSAGCDANYEVSLGFAFDITNIPCNSS